MKPDALQKALSAIGLCKKAGGAIFGTEMVCDALRENKRVCLVIVPSDNSENTRKKISDKCAFYRVDLKELPASGETLAHAAGKSGHCAALGVTDHNFAQLLSKTMQDL